MKEIGARLQARQWAFVHQNGGASVTIRNTLPHPETGQANKSDFGAKGKPERRKPGYALGASGRSVSSTVMSSRHISAAADRVSREPVPVRTPTLSPAPAFAPICMS